MSSSACEYVKGVARVHCTARPHSTYEYCIVISCKESGYDQNNIDRRIMFFVKSFVIEIIILIASLLCNDSVKKMLYNFAVNVLLYATMNSKFILHSK